MFFYYLLVIVVHDNIVTIIFNNLCLLLNFAAQLILIFFHIANIALQLPFWRVSFLRWGWFLLVTIVDILLGYLTYHLRIFANNIWRLRRCQLIIAIEWLLFGLLLIYRSICRSLTVLSFLFLIILMNNLAWFYTHWHR